jgi:hypothetical protein
LSRASDPKTRTSTRRTRWPCSGSGPLATSTPRPTDQVCHASLCPSFSGNMGGAKEASVRQMSFGILAHTRHASRCLFFGNRAEKASVRQIPGSIFGRARGVGGGGGGGSVLRTILICLSSFDGFANEYTPRGITETLQTASSTARVMCVRPASIPTD